MSAPKEQAIIKSKPNYWYSIISVTLVLLLLGFFGLIFLHAQQLMTTYQEQLSIIIEIDKTAEKPAVQQFKTQLKKMDFAKAETVKHITKEDGIKMLEEEFGKDFIKLDMANPLFDVITFNAKAAYMNDDGLKDLQKQLKEKEIVRDVYYQENLVDSLMQNIGKLAWLIMGVSLFFIFIAVYLIHNTIRLALYANRFLIKNMELVGASWEFISRPYLIRSIINGALSALVAILVLSLALLWARSGFPVLKELDDLAGVLLLFLALILLSIGITSASTYYVVNKYLKMQVEDMY